MSKSKEYLIDAEVAKNKCKLGMGAECCSFLGAGTKGLECLKRPPFKKIIVERRKAGTMNAKGNNCSGPPSFTPT